MKGNPQIIAELNKLLKNELTAINQYFLHARMMQHWGFERLGKKVYDESIGEMKHADKLIQRILVLRALAGQHPSSPEQIMQWLEATARGWNAAPTPFVWGGQRRARRQRTDDRRHPLGGSGACTARPLRRVSTRQNAYAHRK